MTIAFGEAKGKLETKTNAGERSIDMSYRRKAKQKKRDRANSV
jgi:hypothetical protein